MMKSPGRDARVRLAAVTGAGWIVLAVAAWIYARMKGIPAWTALPVALAFLIEFPFYLFPGFEASREWLASLGKRRAAWILVASSVAPWLVYSLATGEATVTHFLLLLAIALLVSFWYVVLPASLAIDELFLLVLACVYLSKSLDWIYASPIPKQQLSALGHAMLIRTGALAVLILRGNARAEFRFLPTRAEWMTGLRYFAMALPVVGLAYWALGLVDLRAHPLNVLQAAGTFFGILWVVALSEEFFFRGLLQQWLERAMASATAGLITASVIFGIAHLGFHRIFPNWRWAIVAGILGLFLGLAWRKTRSVQASMVTHALVVTMWRTFLR